MMAVAESQLDTWAKQGAVTGSKTTYATVKAALEDPQATYAGQSCSTFLQGSYGNDTNIFADSDVDVVMRLDAIYYMALDNLSEADKAAYNAARSSGGYTFSAFKSEVVQQLRTKFPGKVNPGNKAILVAGDGARRDCDVLACTKFRKYLRFKSWSDQTYVEGICFWNGANERIVNYPKQHSENCTTKHQNTAMWFKPTVRIFKNMRNRMVSEGYLASGVAPSYFLEGMLYNVPTEKFGSSYQDSVVNALNWLISEADRANLICANGQYRLLHPTSLVTWRAEQMQSFLEAAASFWNDQ